MKDFLNDQIIREDMENIYNEEEHFLLKDKTVLVTGAYGMLASYLVYFLLYLNEIHDYNIKIVSLVRNSEKFQARFGVHSGKIFQITKSVNEPIDIDCDYIIHAASFASPQYYTVIPIDVMLPNMLGTYNLLELAHEKKAKMLFFSTCSVYGNFEKGNKQIAEGTFGTINPLDPHSCYDESKRAGEALCVAYHRQNKVPVVIARIAHTYGPTMDINEDPRVFASFVKNAVNKEKIEILSDGSAKRSFCYISDATKAFIKLLLDGVPGEAYNVCNTSQTISIRQLGEIISNLAQVAFVFKQRAKNDTYLQNDAPSECLYISDKLEKLGFTFNVDIEQGFSRVISHFKKKICKL